MTEFPLPFRTVDPYFPTKRRKHFCCSFPFFIFFFCFFSTKTKSMGNTFILVVQSLLHIVNSVSVPISLFFFFFLSLSLKIELRLILEPAIDDWMDRFELLMRERRKIRPLKPLLEACCDRVLHQSEYLIQPPTLSKAGNWRRITSQMFFY